MLDFGFYNMDCMEGMKEFPDKYFELAIVDPPYGILDAGGQTGGLGKVFKNRKFSRKDYAVWDKAPTEEYFKELFRISQNQIIWGGNYFKLPTNRCFVVWDKCQPWETFSMCEYAWTSFKTPSKLFRFDNRTSGKIHPTQKPIELYEYLLYNYAKKGDKILDTHVGSASSLIACYNLGFDYVGFELDKDYYESASKRIDENKAQIRFDANMEMF